MASRKRSDSRTKIEEAKQAVLAGLDVIAEYKSIGLRIPENATVRESGWIPAFAIDRQDQNPSAAINVETGCYKDSGGIGQTLSFWDAQVKFGPHLDWYSALQEFAKKTGTKLTKRPDETAKEQVEEAGKLHPLAIRGFLKKYPGVRLDDLLQCGCRLVRYPKKSPEPFYSIAWPFYGPKLTNSPNRGWVLQAVDGRELQDSHGTRQKRLAVGTPSGLANWEDLNFLAAGKIKVVIKVEGFSDLMALLAIRPESKRGSVAIITNACGAHETTLPSEVGHIFKGVHFIAIGDSDKPGQTGAAKWIHAARAHAKSARNVVLFAEIAEKHGKDIRDWIAEGGTWERLEALIEAATPDVEEAPLDDSNHRNRVEIIPDEYIVIEQTLQALASDPNLYHRSGQLVHVIQEPSNSNAHGITRSTGTPRILPVSSGHLRERMTERCYFFKTDSEDEQQCHPPAFVVNAVHSRGFWPQIRNLSGVTEIPVLRPDGTTLTTPGWDEPTGLLFTPNGDLPELPDAPTKVDAIAAKELLLDIVTDFPFASPAHQSAWLAGLLTILARRAFSGPAPMFLVDANIRGSGKSMLTDVISLIATSRPMPRLSNPESDEETRKRITSLAIAGDPLVLIDNIGGTLGSASLDAVLTSTSWKDRRLGGNEIVEMPMRAVWFATGNNVVLTGDMSRRVCHVRLDSLEENPEERSDFRHPKLLAHVRENRMQLLAAGLTILRAFVVAGRPEAGLKPWGSFEGWSDLIRNCLVWIGMDDPGGTRKELAEASDRDAGALRMLFDCWSDIDPKGEGLSSADLVQLLDFHKRRRDYIDGGMTISVAENLIEKERQETEGAKTALCELCGVSDLTSKEVRKIGNQLRRFKGRVIGSKRLECRSHGRNKVNRWRVVEVDAGCTVSSGIFFSPSPKIQEISNKNNHVHNYHTEIKLNNKNIKQQGTDTAGTAHTASTIRESVF